ncbi:hypothetical protein VPKG_00060 [Vibrio phage pYD21-A]|uniref:hypothetical protein n=1 Tax=Vibrio phage pYD21-A TaxID=754049 RepID=UPI0002C11FB0|nr:hypothetical protein VPKG_00060 [Vibrio phage pYD21-A]AGH16097.1 hypothetical protein VPKG_00060 [Vibrio phage pYD21-A]
MKNAKLPAMPITNDKLATALEIGASGASGLTKREMFAMHAMAAWIAHHGSANNYGFSAKDAAMSSVECADALLSELEK